VCKAVADEGGSLKHNPGCKLWQQKMLMKELEETLEKIKNDPDAMRDFIRESVAKHLIKLHQLAMQGSHRAAQQFREAGMDVLELLAKEDSRGKANEKRGHEAAGVAGKKRPRHESGTAAGGAQAAREAVGEPPVGVVAGEGHGRDAGSPDEG
jgi:hypothetical protein